MTYCVKPWPFFNEIWQNITFLENDSLTFFCCFPFLFTHGRQKKTPLRNLRNTFYHMLFGSRFTNTYSCFPGVYSLDEYVIHLLENILPWNWLFSVRGCPLLTGSLCVREQTPIGYGYKQGIECEIYHTKVYFISHFV